MNSLYKNLIKQKTLKGYIQVDDFRYDNILEFDNLFILVGQDLRVVTESCDVVLHFDDIDLKVFTYNWHLITFKDNILAVPFYRRSLAVNYMYPPIEYFKYYKICKDGVISEKAKLIESD